MKLIYIGSHFYLESSTHMSCVYTEEGQRSDWGNVESALRQGDSVEIRPATQDELAFYESKLSELKSRSYQS